MESGRTYDFLNAPFLPEEATTQALPVQQESAEPDPEAHELQSIPTRAAQPGRVVRHNMTAVEWAMI